MSDNTLKRIEELEGRGYIVKSGSNDNGSYVKFSNGWMICTGKISQNLTRNTSLECRWLSNIRNF